MLGIIEGSPEGCIPVRPDASAMTNPDGTKLGLSGVAMSEMDGRIVDIQASPELVADVGTSDGYSLGEKDSSTVGAILGSSRGMTVGWFLRSEGGAPKESDDGEREAVINQYWLGINEGLVDGVKERLRWGGSVG